MVDTEPASAVMADFFSGCGGASLGFSRAGFVPVVAIDSEPDPVATYRNNFPGVQIIQTDIRRLSPDAVTGCFPPDKVRLFVGCAPCQPFSPHSKHRGEDHRTGLLLEFLRFVEAHNPELVFVENVGRITKPNEGPFAEFVDRLSETHHVDHGVVMSCSFGVPQKRRRLLLVASRLGPINLPAATHGYGKQPHSTVREWIGDLPPIEAGQTHPSVPNHRSGRLSRQNLERIRCTPEGGDRRNWPARMRIGAHLGHRGHTDTYGRLWWDRPAPALTTRCVSYSNGRYGHPTQDRGLSAREAARLQTFPDRFEFAGGLTSQAKQIGNAVPVLLAEQVGQRFADHLARHR